MKCKKWQHHSFSRAEARNADQLGSGSAWTKIRRKLSAKRPVSSEGHFAEPAFWLAHGNILGIDWFLLGQEFHVKLH
jgi:hypothetical protein